MKNIKDLERPSDNLVKKYIYKFNKDERYFLADNAIISLFKKFPENKKLEDILLKISVINDLYSTNIYSTFNMAKHILSLKIDNALKNSDESVVNKIAIGHGIPKTKTKGDRNFYSFATKYCNWHNKNEYPIYDSFVSKTLCAYRKKDGFSKFKNIDLKDYSYFKKIIIDFRNFYSLKNHNLKEIDKFLWIYGKEKFTTSK